MQEKVDYIVTLIRKHLRETLEDEERLALDAWLEESEVNKQTFARLTEESLLSEELNKFYKYDEVASWKKIRAYFEGGTPVVPIRSYRKMMAIAAAVLIVTAFGSWYFFFNRHGNTPQIQPNAVTETKRSVYKNDVRPGDDKALLILSDGTRIELESAKDGILTKQGDVTIQKTGKGQLEYDAVSISPKEIAVEYNTLSTPRGGQYRVKLPDGSSVWLNAASSIKFPVVFSGNERQVQITGEAYFEITSVTSSGGNKIPFKVKVNDNMNVEVLGTHFNINSYGDERNIKTTLLEGSVRIIKNKKTSILKPGQQAQVTQSGEIRVVDEPDANEAVAWKNGIFQFQTADIDDVMRQVARWYNVDVVFDGQMSGKHFSGSISRFVNITKVLDMLQLTGEVRFVVEGRKITVLPY